MLEELTVAQYKKMHCRASYMLLMVDMRYISTALQILTIVTALCAFNRREIHPFAQTAKRIEMRVLLQCPTEEKYCLS